MILRYDRPAADWESEALPIGNGALGAMLFGAPHGERVQFNEKTLWTGGPGADPGYTGGVWPAPRPAALSRARGLALAPGGAAPEDLARLLGQPKRGYGAYQPFGELYLDTPVAGEVTGYRRELDLARGVALVTYQAGGVRHRREAFASHPDGVVVVRLTAEPPGAVSVTVRLTTPHPGTATVVQGGVVVLTGRLANGVALEARVLVRAEGGRRTDGADGADRADRADRAGRAGRVVVSGADAVTVLLAAGTDYAHRPPHYRRDHPHRRVRATLGAAAALPYERLVERHVADHRGLLGRVRLDLGRGEQAAAEALSFQYGRYLLVGSSRPGTLPANLQGVWNQDTAPAWSGDYHLNVNLQMNYWPAEVANLAETHLPLLDFVDRLRPSGRTSARVHFGAPGWVTHSETNPFGYTGVGDWPTSFWFPEAAAWLCRHLWEHYAFTGDRDFLRETGYPVLREAALFWLHVLVPDPRDGLLVATPSYSPEHGTFTAGAAMSQQVVWDLFGNVLAAAAALGTDRALRERVARARARLDPGLRVGRWGQLQEWKEDLDDPRDTHRHVSHLFAVYPGHQVDPFTTPRFARAAAVSLATREGGGAPGPPSPGWSRAWRIALWARLRDGERAYAALRDLLRHNTLPNLLSTHPPFQIDGNLGTTAGIAEMLVQSHTGTIDVLPALPRAWPDGTVEGLRARGGFTVGVTWRGGRTAEIRLASDLGGPASVRAPGVAAVRLDTRPGGTYRIRGGAVRCSAAG